MERRDFLRKSSLFVGSAALGGLALPEVVFGRQEAAEERPDVLFIAIEDIAPFMGCYGHPMVRTPNIDALAARGVLFDKAYCQVAVCNPSRASILTGLRPETTGVYNNETDWRRRIPEGMRTLPEFFRDNGYETVICGKIHHHQRYFDDATEQAQQREDGFWERKLRARSKRPTRPAILPKGERPKQLKEDSYAVTSLTWGPTGLTDTEQWDGAIAEAVAGALTEKRERPLFMAVGFHAPHYPFRAPDRYFEMYPSQEVSLPERREGDLADSPGPYSRWRPPEEVWLSDDERRQLIAAYYACISYVDTCVGIVMDGLVRSGRAGNTVICLWGDHGMHVGAHFLWRKYTLFENAARVPLIMAAPGVARAGSVCRRPVELIDMYPTLADLCGLGIAQGLDGISMGPLLRAPQRQWKKAAFTTRAKGQRSLRTDRWRYTEWGSPQKAELYDHENDPGEFTNLAGDPEHAAIVAELSSLLKAEWKAALPPH